ncbi:hypothetical protein DFJ73DRAFT_865400 [Zopfochytrium polystomum]|nr:hypothetical protein DFJ73DRAFT_865400 [Zopfochytrium polystomum]
MKVQEKEMRIVQQSTRARQERIGPPMEQKLISTRARESKRKGATQWTLPRKLQRLAVARMQGRSRHRVCGRWLAESRERVCSRGGRERCSRDGRGADEIVHVHFVGGIGEILLFPRGGGEAADHSRVSGEGALSRSKARQHQACADARNVQVHIYGVAADAYWSVQTDGACERGGCSDRVDKVGEGEDGDAAAPDDHTEDELDDGAEGGGVGGLEEVELSRAGEVAVFAVVGDRCVHEEANTDGEEEHVPDDFVHYKLVHVSVVVAIRVADVPSVRSPGQRLHQVEDGGKSESDAQVDAGAVPQVAPPSMLCAEGREHLKQLDSKACVGSKSYIRDHFVNECQRFAHDPKLRVAPYAAYAGGIVGDDKDHRSGFGGHADGAIVDGRDEGAVEHKDELPDDDSGGHHDEGSVAGGHGGNGHGDGGEQADDVEQQRKEVHREGTVTGAATTDLFLWGKGCA